MRSGRLYAVGEARHLSVTPAHPPVSVRCVIEHIFHKLDREFTSSDRHAFKFGLQKNDYKKYETGANLSIGARDDPLQVSNRSIVFYFLFLLSVNDFVRGRAAPGALRPRPARYGAVMTTLGSSVTVHVSALVSLRLRASPTRKTSTSSAALLTTVFLYTESVNWISLAIWMKTLDGTNSGSSLARTTSVPYCLRVNLTAPPPLAR
mmetsp:Transcript_53600/g.123213  ORF Transcript_53600/g.123213 Transcript_53600/m.123213 type:complete len:206 (-) Transcript_53600:609-1226(-)